MHPALFANLGSGVNESNSEHDRQAADSKSEALRRSGQAVKQSVSYLLKLGTTPGGY